MSAAWPALLQAVATALAAQANHAEGIEQQRYIDILNDLMERVSGAPSHLAALDVLAAGLGASLCNIWRSAAEETELRLIGTAARGPFATDEFLGGRTTAVPLEGSRSGEAICAGRQLIAPDVLPTNVNGDHNCVDVAQFGLKARSARAHL